MVKSLDRKLLRDLVRLKGQMFTIALVVAAGIAAFVSLRGAYDSLQLARAAFYERHGFAHVFAHLERAPTSLAAVLERIEGVSRVETRVVESAMVPLPEIAEPLRAQVISASPEGALNRLALRDGRWFEPGKNDEVVLIESFAHAHEVRPGDALPAVINGKLRLLRVVGIAMSPEYVFPLAGGDMAPDPERFVVMWMNREALSAAFRMDGAFNSVAFALEPGASEPAVIAAVDRVLAPYGGLGAHQRAKQPSERALQGELGQLRSMVLVLPLIFLGVAAFLVNVVLSRLIHLQRNEIATLKAVGYTDREIGAHFFELVLAVVVSGAVLGLALGSYLGSGLVGIYADYFDFPNLGFTLDLRSALLAVGVSLASATVGAFGAVREVVRMAPAEAMRPPSPARYRRSLLDRLGLVRTLGPAFAMMLRELGRRPLRALSSALAIAASIGLMVIAGFYYDGMRELVDIQFNEVMQEDLAVAFAKPRPERAARELAHVPGVLEVEGLRAVPVRFRSGHVVRDGVVLGYPDDGRLRQVRDRYGTPVALPPEGAVLSATLADILGVEPDGGVDIDVQQGERARRRLEVVAVVDDAFGLQAHMRAPALHGLLGEPSSFDLALLRVDPLKSSDVDARLKEMPWVLSVTRREALVQRFEDQSAGLIITMSLIILAFAATITVGVVYNNARVALGVRARDLASLRVLGFSRAEVSAMLLGEMAIQVLVAIPIGLFFGYGLVHGLVSTIDPEQFRMPVILTARSYAVATIVALLASAASGLLVRRRVDRLDLIGVLKTRE